MVADKDVIRSIRFKPYVKKEIERLAELNDVSFTAMVNLLLAQALRDPKLRVR